MSKRKPEAQKQARRSKVNVRAQRKKQASVRSPKDSHLRVVRSSASPINARHGSEQEPSIPENRADTLEAILKTVSRDGSKKGFDFSQLVANTQAYHAKLLEVTQDNTQFFLDFNQRLATTWSPFEFLAVIVQFTGRRIIMIAEHSKELATWPVDAFRAR